MALILMNRKEYEKKQFLTLTLKKQSHLTLKSELDEDSVGVGGNNKATGSHA